MKPTIQKSNEQVSSKSPSFERLFLILFIILSGLIFLNSGMFALKEFVVRGNQAVSTEDILLIAGLDHYKNIFQVNLADVQRQILRNPRIASVKVGRSFPHKLIITVTERQPLCLLLYLGNLLVIGNDFVVMEIKDESDPISLPIVTGLKIKKVRVGEKVTNQEFAVALDILKNADENLRQNISEINLTNFQLYLDLPNSRHTLKVELGTANQVEKKMYNLRAILSQTTSNGLTKIDLRAPDLPTVIRLKNVKSK
jgi:cell division protein FtsQ